MPNSKEPGNLTGRRLKTAGTDRAITVVSPDASCEDIRHGIALAIEGIPGGFVADLADIEAICAAARAEQRRIKLTRRSLVTAAEMEAISAQLTLAGLGTAMATEVAIMLDDARRDAVDARELLRDAVAAIKSAASATDMAMARDAIRQAAGEQTRAIGVIDTVELFLRGALVPMLDRGGNLRFFPSDLAATRREVGS